MKTTFANALIPVLVCGALITGCGVPAYFSPSPTSATAAFTDAASPSPTPTASSSTAPAFTKSPTTLPSLVVSPTSLETLLPTAASPVAQLTITILYNNIPFDARLKTDWGFSALVEYRGGVLLFDTGRDGQILLYNMQVLSIDPTCIQYIVLSHIHSDHTGGLDALLEVALQPSVYLLPRLERRTNKECGGSRRGSR